MIIATKRLEVDHVVVHEDTMKEKLERVTEKDHLDPRIVEESLEIITVKIKAKRDIEVDLDKGQGSDQSLMKETARKMTETETLIVTMKSQNIHIGNRRNPLLQSNH